jgi:hypothetical protein
MKVLSKIDKTRIKMLKISNPIQWSSICLNIWAQIRAESISFILPITNSKIITFNAQQIYLIEIHPIIEGTM